MQVATATAVFTALAASSSSSRARTTGARPQAQTKPERGTFGSRRVFVVGVRRGLAPPRRVVPKRRRRTSSRSSRGDVSKGGVAPRGRSAELCRSQLLPALPRRCAGSWVDCSQCRAQQQLPTVAGASLVSTPLAPDDGLVSGRRCPARYREHQQCAAIARRRREATALGGTARRRSLLLTAASSCRRRCERENFFKQRPSSTQRHTFQARTPTRRPERRPRTTTWRPPTFTAQLR